MKTEQLIPLCRRYHAMLLHSDEQTIAIAVVDTPPAGADGGAALRDAKSESILNAGARNRWTSVCRPRKSRRNWRKTRGQRISPNGSTRSSNRLCVSGRPIFISNPRKRIYASACGSMASSMPCRCWPPSWLAPIIARLKVVASLDIAEHRLPQDGQFALNLSGRPLSFRIATLPCRYGEKNCPASSASG